MNKRQNESVSAAIVLAAAIALSPPSLDAAVSPRPAGGLFAEADVVVVAEVIDLAIRKQRSEIEGGFGNYDWDIACGLRIQTVEKGDVDAGSKVTADCFVIHSRKSGLEYISHQGHRPIPEVGQIVRAYLRGDGPRFSVIHPNGFHATGGNKIVESSEVAALSQGGFTYLLPIELWGGAVMIALGAWGLTRVVRLVARRRGPSPG